MAVVGRRRRGAAAVFCLTLGLNLAGILAAQAQDDAAPDARRTFLLGNMEFILFHEMAHALIGELGLPVLGREEDAADSLATILMIPDEPDEAMDAAVAAAAEGWFQSYEASGGDTAELAFWDEHGLDPQRAFAIVCLMYGSDPERYQQFADEMGLPPERQETCPNDYALAVLSWNALLEPYATEAAGAGQAVTIQYEEARPEHAHLKEALIDSGLFESVVAGVAQAYRFPEPVSAVLGYCDEPNAFWNPEERTLVLCYELAAYYEELTTARQ